MSSSLPADFTNEIETLSREILRHQPEDKLQYAADFFQRRLSSQRKEFLLGQEHTNTMAESTFSGSNPFTSGANSSGMQRVVEEDEPDVHSPTASSFPPDANAAPPAPSSTFGNFGFGSSNREEQTNSSSSNSMPSNYNLNRRTSVSAESLAPSASEDSNWKPPRFPKTTEQENRLRASTSRNFLFSHLDDEQSAQVLGALQERKIPAKDISVITQGDVGDYFYVVEEGIFDIYVNSTGKREPGPNGLGKKVGQSPAGSSFGELALMYNAPRAASVVSTGPATLWQLDRVTFRRILMDSAFQRRRMYESFLDDVPLLSTLTPYERSKIADALETQKYPSNTTIIREGDVGAHFYILESGSAAVFKRGVEKKLKQYTKGDYFGELALLDDKPRAASVVSETEVKVAMLGKDGFQRLLGPVTDIMRRDDPSKKMETGVDSLTST